METKDLLVGKPDDIYKRLAVKTERKVPLDDIKRQLNPLEHDVFDPVKRPMKDVKKPSSRKDSAGNDIMIESKEEVNRIGIPFQRIIVNRATGFLLGNPVKLKNYGETDSQKRLVEMVQKTWDDNKLNYFNSKLVRAVISECEAAELWYLIEEPGTFWERIRGVKSAGKFRMRSKLLTPTKGDKLYPYFDETGDMVAFSREYQVLVCNPVQTSNGEKEVFDFVVSLGFNALQGDRTIIYPLELDIVIPEKKLAIEFNGLYWHSFQSGRDSSYHLGKTISCNEKGYSLIHIFEDDWEFNKEIVKSIIKNRLGLFDRKIFARKTFIKEITSGEATDFYNINHLQGGINSSVNIGLFHNDELVSCLSFAKPRYNKKYKWEITRFANSLNVLVVGGFSRLLKHFTRNYKGSIITYSDRGMFDGSVYRNNGFKELTPSDSNYFYIKNSKRFSRVKFQKHKLENLLENFNGELTEKENMENNGYTWIYDCGNWVFEYRGE